MHAGVSESLQNEIFQYSSVHYHCSVSYESATERESKVERTSSVYYHSKPGHLSHLKADNLFMFIGEYLQK